MTRSDAILAALKATIEQNRPFLDSEQHIRSVKIEVKMYDDRRIRSTTFNPEIESTMQPLRISAYKFQS